MSIETEGEDFIGHVQSTLAALDEAGESVARFAAGAACYAAVVCVQSAADRRAAAETLISSIDAALAHMIADLPGCGCSGHA